MPALRGDLSVEAFVADRGQTADALRGVTANLEEIRLEAFRTSLRRLGVTDENMAVHLNDFYLEHRFIGVDLYDDVLPTLEALAGHCRIGLLSNGNSYPNHVELERLLQATVFSQDVGVEKPDSRIFDAAERALPAQRYVMVGDSLVNDVAGAQNAGWAGIWLNRDDAKRSEPIEPDLTATKLSQILPWLAATG